MSKRRTGKGHPLRNEKGGVLVMVTGALVVVLGMAALAIDMGMLYTARSEAQRAAEAGAHAGALVFLTSPGNESEARARAKEYAEKNQVRWLDVEVREDDDIDVEVDNQLVRVRVHRTAEWGGPISTFFARVLGIGEVDVGASAAARTWPSDGVQCVLPFAMPDRWRNADGSYPEEGDAFDPEGGDWYDPWDPNNPEDDYTGYSMNSVGEEIRLYAQDPGADDFPEPSWWYPFTPEGVTPDAPSVAERIRGCVDDDLYRYGEDAEVETAPGVMSGQIRRAFEDIIDEDSDAQWDSSNECVTRGDERCLSAGDSNRIRPMVMFDPHDVPDSGFNRFPVRNFVSVFIEEIEPGQGQGQFSVRARFLQYTGLEPVDEWHDGGTLLRMVRIVE